MKYKPKLHIYVDSAFIFERLDGYVIHCITWDNISGHIIKYGIKDNNSAEFDCVNHWYQYMRKQYPDTGLVIFSDSTFAVAKMQTQLRVVKDTYWVEHVSRMQNKVNHIVSAMVQNYRTNYRKNKSGLNSLLDQVFIS